jgi:hypothetical protein
MFTARYALSSSIKQIRFVFKGLIYVILYLLSIANDFIACHNYYYYYYYYYYYMISFTQGIHTYIPETNHVSRVHSVAAILRVLLMVHITLSSILNSFVLLH